MKKDLRDILDGWNYNTGKVNARWIEGRDGKPCVQLRLDLGILQMQIDGRPDGSTPHGFPSLLDYYRNLEKLAPGEDPPFALETKQLTELQQEAVQYYYRYLSFAALNNTEGVIRDTYHNLELFDLVDQYALDDRHAWQFLQFYPYVRMMNARAKAEKMVENNQFSEAVAGIEEAVQDLYHYAEVYELDSQDPEEVQEIAILMDLLAQLRERKPKSKEERLEEEMLWAIQSENYEKAAQLRDALNAIKNTGI